MIGTNSDLERIRSILDARISELARLAGAASRPYWVSDRLAAFGRERIMVSAALVNRRSEAGKKVVDLSRWYIGDGVLFRDALSHASATGTPIPLSSSRL